MDSITQAALGASVAHVCWHNKLGRTSLLTGAILGTIPDLDIIMYPFLDQVQRLYWHRGESHSIWFLLTGSLFFGFLINRLFKSRQIGKKEAILGVFFIFSSHILIDVFTTYGTQLLAPLSRKGYAIGNLFIIDPLFTFALIAGIIIAFFIKNRKLSFKANGVGLTIAGLYAIWSLTAQSVAESKFNQALNQQEILIERQFTSASPFNTFLWRQISQTEEGDIILGYWSFFDPKNSAITFRRIPQNKEAAQSILLTRAFRAIDWFSQGWWFIESTNDPKTVKVVDARFTEIPIPGNKPRMEWPFAWALATDKGDAAKLTPIRPEIEDPLPVLNQLLNRILGKQAKIF